MKANDFYKLLAAFADNPESIDRGKDSLVFEVHDELVELFVTREGDTLKVCEPDSAPMPAIDWVAKRLARLPLLADRILDHIPTIDDFVSPTGAFLDDLSHNPDDSEQAVPDIREQALDWLDRGSGFMSRVLYLTSDAGEGKTTVINHLARVQAKRYKERKSDWLLVPVSLGGRPFLRLDEVILGTLGRRFRFQFLYYDAFLELVKLGRIVLALDGFEEMFVEGSAGDAVSSLGNLMVNLESEGTVLIAARKAYFEYKSLETTAKLFDTLRSVYVDFARLRIDRWERKQFVEYCELNQINEPARLYSRLADALGGDDHPMITRPVLVRHLIHSIDPSDEADLQQLLDAIGPNDKNYYAEFVRGIVRREAHKKWIDKSGEPFGPLISVDEHFWLLSYVADEMWTAESEELKSEFLEFAADQFCHDTKKDSRLTDQIKERIKSHALIIATGGRPGGFSFDHQEFYHYFLGLAVARHLTSGRTAEIARIMRQGLLPRITSDAVVRQLGSDLRLVTIEILNELADGEGSFSVLRQNASSLATSIALAVVSESEIVIRHGVIGRDVLSSAKRIQGLRFERCFIMPQVVTGAEIIDCIFDQCEIDALELESCSVTNTKFTNGTTCAALTVGEDNTVFDPGQVAFFLAEQGFELEEETLVTANSPLEIDPDLAIAIKFFRIFRRATGVNENVARQRLGIMMHSFLTQILPALTQAGVVVSVPQYGSGTQRRYSLGRPLAEVHEAIERCGGSFTAFLQLFDS
jgi:hypothetical protein